MDAVKIKETLDRGGMVFGCMISAMGTIRFQRALAGSTLDFVIIDCEHGSRDRKEIQELTTMFRAIDIAPLVRVPVPMAHYVAMAKDAGAAGVLVPYCEDLDEIRACVATGKYHPMKGEYLRRAVAEGKFPSPKTKEYLENRNRGSIVIIGIESEPAFKNLDAILDIPLIDAIFIGPNDMTTSLGIPDDWANPKYLDVLKTVIRKSEAKGMPVMIHQSTMESSIRAIELGARFVMHSSDVRLMVAAMQEQFAELRKVAGARAVSARDTAETV
ncbi:MAG: hypothetical protein FJ313_02710 [Gemmatimonadetes bacterium]|nr:hypothetical protein [Gemmatimonadota bacterium]